MKLSVWFVLTPNVPLLDYAGPAEARRMAAGMGGARELHTCAAVPRLPTSLGVELAGLLDGRRCTTHHSLLAALQEAAPTARVEEHRVFVEDGQLLSSAGITTGIDLARSLRQLSVERVAELAGFASARDFRRVWPRHEGNAPSRLRAAGGNERAVARGEQRQ